MVAFLLFFVQGVVQTFSYSALFGEYLIYKYRC